MSPELVAARVPPGTSALKLAEVVERAGIRLLLAAGAAVALRTALHALREGDDACRAA